MYLQELCEEGDALSYVRLSVPEGASRNSLVRHGGQCDDRGDDPVEMVFVPDLHFQGVSIL